jgi:tetratricopeptide (TPR) repeat protein
VTLVDAVGLETAERLERSTTGSGGARFALPIYKRLLVRGQEPGFSARAALGALRCAVRIGEHGDVENIATYWSMLAGGGDHLAAIVDLCAKLGAAGARWPAVALARAEVEREPRARSMYLLARCLELAGDGDGAYVAFGRAIERASQEPGAADVAVAARAWRVERTLGDRSAEPLTIKDAQQAVDAPPGVQLVIALGCMRASSRFVRASGLSLLEVLSRDQTTSLGRLALRLAAEHADALGDVLTPLEADRIAATLGHVPDEKARADALARLGAAQKIAASQGEAQAEALVAASEVAPEIFPLVCRARAVLSGGGQGSYAAHPAVGEGSPEPSFRLASLGLDAVVALARGRGRDAAAVLHEAAEVASASPSIPPPAWTAARAALASKDAAAREGGVRLAESLLEAAPTPPPGGYASLAGALARAGRGDLAARAARAANAAGEAGAREELGALLRDEGWRLAARGERELAIAALREAKELLTGTKGR